MEQKSDALKAGVWYLVCNFLLKGISFITTPIFTRLLTASDFGYTATYSSFSSIFTVLATLDLYSCIQISKQDFKEDNNKFVSSVLSLSSTFVIIFYILLKVYIHYIDNFTALPEYLIDVMFLNIFFTNAFTLMQTQHRAYLKYKQVVVFTLLMTISSIILGMIFVVNMNENKFIGRIAGMVVPSVVISLYAMISIYAKGRCLYKREYWKYALMISVPLIPHHLSGNILSNFDRIMINKYCGSSDTGLYSLAYNCGAIMQMVWSSFNGAWMPWFYDTLAKDDVGSIRKAVKPYSVIFTVFVIGVITVGPEIIKILGPEEYWESKWIIPPVVLGIYCQFLYSLYVNVEFYNKKTSKIAIVTICAAAANVILNYIFIPVYGYIAAAYTTLAGYAIMFAAHYVISTRMEKRDLFDKKFIFGSLAVTIVITITATLLYRTVIIRYAVFAIIALIICIVYRELIFNFIRKKIGRKK